MVKKHIPNTITLLNQFSGIIACLFAYNSRFDMALIFMLAGAVFDFMDGAAARFLHVSSPLGKELDSLADMISFGLLPGMVAFRLLQPLEAVWEYLPYYGFVITLFSALRLAKFNIDTRQTDNFIGLATPANAIFWVGAAYSCPYVSTVSPWVIAYLVLLSSYLLVSEIPMFSLKFHNIRMSDNIVRYIFLAGAVLLAAVLNVRALPFIIVWYILLSVIVAVIARCKSKRRI